MHARCHFGPHVKTCDEGYPKGKGALTCDKGYMLHPGKNHNSECVGECRAAPPHSNPPYTSLPVHPTLCIGAYETIKEQRMKMRLPCMRTEHGRVGHLVQDPSQVRKQAGERKLASWQLLISLFVVSNSTCVLSVCGHPEYRTGSRNQCLSTSSRVQQRSCRWATALDEATAEGAEV